MTKNNLANITAEPGEREIVLTRVFDAPRELVWKAWIEPERLKRWWGPKGFTAPVYKIDLRVGGKYLYCMRSPEGQDFWGIGFYREIVEPERIVSTDSFADEKGNVIPVTYYGMGADFPSELQVTLRHIGIPEGEMSDMTEAGWNESFDKLAESVKLE